MSIQDDTREARCLRCGDRRLILLSYSLPITERRVLRRSDLAKRPQVKCLGCGHRYSSLAILTS